MTPEQFRSARKALGLTQKGLAEALRMGTHGWQSISKWETGDHAVPGPVTLALEHLKCIQNESGRGNKLPDTGKTPRTVS